MSEELVTFEEGKSEELSDKKAKVNRDHFLSMDLLILDVSHKWNHMLCYCLCPDFFSLACFGV